MLGFLKPKPAPQGPVDIDRDRVIEKPAADVFALIDWTSPDNAQRALGNHVEQVSTSPERFRLTLPFLPGHDFDMTVTANIQGRKYAFTTEITPVIGNMVRSHETYTLEPLDDHSCRLRLEMSTTLRDGLGRKAHEHEVAVLSASVHNNLSKLKAHAEKGVETVLAIEAAQRG